MRQKVTSHIGIKIGFSFLLLLVISIIFLLKKGHRNINIVPVPYVPPPDIRISLDKEKYFQGDAVKASFTVTREPVYFYGVSTFTLQKYVNGSWENVANPKNQIQFGKEEYGTDCTHLYFERSLPAKLNIGSTETASVWNQRLCIFEGNPPSSNGVIKLLKQGLYQICYVYGFSLDEKDNLRIIPEQKSACASFEIIPRILGK